jgi:hypothetical protein
MIWFFFLHLGSGFELLISCRDAHVEGRRTSSSTGQIASPGSSEPAVSPFGECSMIIEKSRTQGADTGEGRHGRDHECEYERA